MNCDKRSERRAIRHRPSRNLPDRPMRKKMNRNSNRHQFQQYLLRHLHHKARNPYRYSAASRKTLYRFHRLRSPMLERVSCHRILIQRFLHRNRTCHRITRFHLASLCNRDFQCHHRQVSDNHHRCRYWIHILCCIQRVSPMRSRSIDQQNLRMPNQKHQHAQPVLLILVRNLRLFRH